MTPARLDAGRLADLIDAARKTVVLTGAGCSTDSGIPDYRGPDGVWTRNKPIYYQEFLRSVATRRFYWSRSFRGWPRFSAARPNVSHYELAAMEKAGHIAAVITQNVDRLHQTAGSVAITDLHGRNDLVRCLDCARESPRSLVQESLAKLNPEWLAATESLPDGDAAVSRAEAEHFVMIDCDHCGGILKPAVIFFGESIPRPVWDEVASALDEVDLLIVLGSSLATGSALRIVRSAVATGARLAIVNAGPTRGDELACLKSTERLGQVLPFALDLLTRISHRVSSAAETP